MFKDKLRAARTAKGISGRKVAEAIGISSGYYSQLETGNRGQPEDDVVARLEDYLGVPLGEKVASADRTQGLDACKIRELASVAGELQLQMQLSPGGEKLLTRMMDLLSEIVGVLNRIEQKIK